MKIARVAANNHKHVFELETRGRAFTFPYSKTDPAPSSSDRIKEVFVDPELGREAFTYTLESGAEGSVHIDSVLEYNEDPSHLADLALYKVTVEARKRFESSKLSAREIARLLGTSTSQLYRLLDPTNYTKSARQMIALLRVLGFDTDFKLQLIENIDEPKPRGSARSATG